MVHSDVHCSRCHCYCGCRLIKTYCRDQCYAYLCHPHYAEINLHLPRSWCCRGKPAQSCLEKSTRVRLREGSPSHAVKESGHIVRWVWRQKPVLAAAVKTRRRRDMDTSYLEAESDNNDETMMIENDKPDVIVVLRTSVSTIVHSETTWNNKSFLAHSMN